MNILLLCDEYPPGKNGGIGTMVQTLGRELVRQGHNVFVAGLYGHRYGGADYAVDEGVRVWRLRYGLSLPLDGNSRVYNALEKMPDVFKKYLYGKKAFRNYLAFIRQLIHTEKIDIIELPDWNVFTFLMGFVVRWPEFSVPLVLKSHGSYTYFQAEMGLPLKKMFHNTDKELFKRADALSAVSHYTAVQDQNLFALTRGVEVLYNSIPIPPLHPGLVKKQKTVIFTGTLIEKKGIFELMKAWNLVHRTYPDAKLIVFGKGKIPRLKALLNDSALHSVFFKGHVSRPELFEELSTATLAVFPSYTETFGLMAVEAMSVGCPVIYTKRSCGPEIIQDRENGRLVEPSDENEIANTICELLADKKQQADYSERGRDTAEKKFNVVRSAQLHLAFYRRVISEFKKRSEI